ncbi:MAG: hypothetical protein B7X32_20500, partial [Microbacterium sp. 13-71-7]
MSTDLQQAAIARSTDAVEVAAEDRGRRSKAPLSAAERTRLIIAHVFVYLAALVFVSPLVYSFFSALKPNNEMFSMP